MGIIQIGISKTPIEYNNNVTPTKWKSNLILVERSLISSIKLIIETHKSPTPKNKYLVKDVSTPKK